MRRRSVDHLVPNEQRTLQAAHQLHLHGTKQIHGYLLARQLKTRSGDAPIMAYSTVYRCLDRLEERGLIESFDPSDQSSGGPPRRMFRLTDNGMKIAAALPDDASGFDLPGDQSAGPTPGSST